MLDLRACCCILVIMKLVSRCSNCASQTREQPAIRWQEGSRRRAAGDSCCRNILQMAPGEATGVPELGDQATARGDHLRVESGIAPRFDRGGPEAQSIS